MDVYSEEKILFAISKLNQHLDSNHPNVDFKVYLGVNVNHPAGFPEIANCLRACDVMSVALKSKKAIFLPIYIPYVDPRTMTTLTIHIVDDFESIVELIINNRFETAMIHLNYIDYYLTLFNLWDTNEESVLQGLIESTAKLKKELEFELNNVISSNRLIKEVKAGSDKINNVVENAKSNQDVIFSIKDQIQLILNKAETEVNQKTKEFDKLGNDIKESIIQTKSFEQKLIEIDNSVNGYVGDFKLQYYDLLSKKDYITRLEKLATDDALGTRFDNRKKEIRLESRIWLLLSLVVFIIALIWSDSVYDSTIGEPFRFFIRMNKEAKISYLDYSVVFLRAAPAFIVLYFCFSRYIKARNLQEEYAFKSVISMTLTAYSDMLSNSDEEKQKAKVEMLQKSITNIYTQPRVHTESNRPFLSFNSKDVSESLKQLVEAIKSVKP